MATDEVLRRWYRYTKETDKIPELKELRDWVEKNEFGFGDRPLYYMWYEILSNLPRNATLAEIGVYKGQTLALWRTISNLLDKNFTIIGITPLESTTDVYHTHEDSDYLADIKKIHDEFELKPPTIIHGFSQNVSEKLGDVDALLIDGSHDYADVVKDFELYSPKVKKYLVVDDASCYVDMHLDDYMWYKGLEEVSIATNQWYERQTDFKEVNIVGHNRVFERIEKA